MDGRAAARKLLDLSTKIGAPLEFGKLDAYTRSRKFDDFMKQHQGRNTESVEAIFYEGPAGQVSISIHSIASIALAQTTFYRQPARADLHSRLVVASFISSCPTWVWQTMISSDTTSLAILRTHQRVLTSSST